MIESYRPLLASAADLDKLPFPRLASPKLDGIRCIVIDGVALSRSLKPIPNAHIQACIGRPEYNGLDGELIVGDPTSPTCYRDSNSGVMSHDGEPDFTFHVFDRINSDDPFEVRLMSLFSLDLPYVSVVPHFVVSSMEELDEREAQWLELGYEGVMLRDPGGRYKHGRSTAKEGILLKVKRFTDAEYEVVGFEERMHNANEAKRNALGHIERSSHKENKVGRGDLGALVLKHPNGTFTCGTGFTDADRAEIWANQGQYLGRLAKVKSFEIGVKDLPRFPVWLGWRGEEDL